MSMTERGWETWNHGLFDANTLPTMDKQWVATKDTSKDVKKVGRRGEMKGKKLVEKCFGWRVVRW